MSADVCQCTNPAHVRKCGVEIERHFALCRPCVKDNHAGAACDNFTPEPLRRLVRTCARCGVDHLAPRETT